MEFNSLIPELSVSNIETSRKFYEDIGFKLEYERKEDKFCFMSLEKNQIMIQEQNDNWTVGKMEYPFGRGINISMRVKDVEKIGKTADKIKNMDKVSVVRYGEGMVEKLISAFSSIEKVTYAIVIALIVVTVFLIVNTIELTISARSREIGIMRLVGASNWTIKTPFVIEGMILGLFGSIIPIVITTYGYSAFYEHFDGYLFSELIQLIKPEPFIYQASLAVMIIGVIVGMIGSSFAVRKYLKV